MSVEPFASVCRNITTYVKNNMMKICNISKFRCFLYCTFKLIILKSNQILFSVRFFAKQKTFAHHIFSQFQNNLHNFFNSQISYSFITSKFSDTAFLLLINSNASLILYSNTALCNIFPAYWSILSLSHYTLHMAQEDRMNVI